MRLAFATGALAAGLVAGGLAGLVTWIASLVIGPSDAWAAAPFAVVAVAAIVAGATYLAERIVHRRSLQRQRAIGEPWAFRED